MEQPPKKLPRFWVTSHITALMDTECMVMSFRRMLRGVSDGEVILTEELCYLIKPVDWGGCFCHGFSWVFLREMQPSKW